MLLCGDVGVFTEESQLDSATRSHARRNPCELEFLYHWAADPQPRWLERIFHPVREGGLGLLCPVVMVHGNHEGFAHLGRVVPRRVPGRPVDMTRLPTVDTGKRIRYLPSGWKARTASGRLVAGVGGIEKRSRYAGYRSMAYLEDEAILRLAEGKWWRKRKSFKQN